MVSPCIYRRYKNINTSFRPKGNLYGTIFNRNTNSSGILNKVTTWIPYINLYMFHKGDQWSLLFSFLYYLYIAWHLGKDRGVFSHCLLHGFVFGIWPTSFFNTKSLQDKVYHCSLLFSFLYYLWIARLLWKDSEVVPHCFLQDLYLVFSFS